MKKEKIIFMGTPIFAEIVLRKIVEANYNIVAVVTQPDRLVGRKQVLSFSPVKKYALSKNIKILQPEKVKLDYETIKAWQPDLIITCAYGQFLPKKILNLPKLGCINIHASLLPKYRGGAPIHHAIINGEKETGISIMKMSQEMDAGDVAYQKEIEIDVHDNVGTLHDKLATLASEMIIEALPSILDKTIVFQKQDETLVSYGLNITPQEEFVSFKNSYYKVYNQIRGLSPWPVGHGIVDDYIIKLHQAELSDEKTDYADGTIMEMVNDKIAVAVQNRILLLNEVQFAGKQKITALDFYNGQGKKLIGKCFR